MRPEYLGRSGRAVRSKSRQDPPCGHRTVGRAQMMWSRRRDEPWFSRHVRRPVARSSNPKRPDARFAPVVVASLPIAEAGEQPAETGAVTDNPRAQPTSRRSVTASCTPWGRSWRAGNRVQDSAHSPGRHDRRSEMAGALRIDSTLVLQVEAMVPEAGRTWRSSRPGWPTRDAAVGSSRSLDDDYPSGRHHRRGRGGPLPLGPKDRGRPTRQDQRLREGRSSHQQFHQRAPESLGSRRTARPRRDPAKVRARYEELLKRGKRRQAARRMVGRSSMSVP